MTNNPNMWYAEYEHEAGVEMFEFLFAVTIGFALYGATLIAKQIRPKQLKRQTKNLAKRALLMFR